MKEAIQEIRLLY